MSFDDAKVYLLAAYQAEVERRHRVFERNEHFDEQLNLIANYLTGGSKKFGLMFCGLCGNGKTTWAKALQLLVSGLNLKNPINNLYYVFPLECQRFSNAEQRELQRLEKRNALPAYDC